jgi:hypothetical protein
VRWTKAGGTYTNENQKGAERGPKEETGDTETEEYDGENELEDS